MSEAAANYAIFHISLPLVRTNSNTVQTSARERDDVGDDSTRLNSSQLNIWQEACTLQHT